MVAKHDDTMNHFRSMMKHAFAAKIQKKAGHSFQISQLFSRSVNERWLRLFNPGEATKIVAKRYCRAEVATYAAAWALFAAFVGVPSPPRS
jgi:hypothetical protein